MEEASEMAEEVPRRVKWEPTHFTGLSLKLTVRLPCLRQFLVLSVMRIEKRERKKEKKQKRIEQMCSQGITEQIYRVKKWESNGQMLT